MQYADKSQRLLHMAGIQVKPMPSLHAFSRAKSQKQLSTKVLFIQPIRGQIKKTSIDVPLTWRGKMHTGLASVIILVGITRNLLTFKFLSFINFRF